MERRPRSKEIPWQKGREAIKGREKEGQRRDSGRAAKIESEDEVKGCRMGKVKADKNY